ncbi:MAG TPA: ABC transporter permease [Candidatus Nanopelagicales bacterium]
MLRFLLKRVASLVLVLFLMVTGMFILLHLAPSSPVNSLPPAVAADPAARAAYEASLGLNQPLFVQYLTYLKDLLTGNLGYSLYDGTSVSSQIASHLPVSIELGTLAAIFSMLPGFLLGSWTALHHGDKIDSSARIFTVLSLSVPAYWLAVVSLVVVGQSFPQLLPSAGGFVPFQDDPRANLEVMVLPALVLGLSTFALVARSLRASLIDVLGSDYVTFARGMGMSQRRLLSRVAVRNAVIPTLTIMGVLLGGLVSGTVLVESVYQIPGLGQLMVTAFLRQDYPLALGCSITTAAIFLLLNLVVDALYYVVDPRVRLTLSTPRTRNPVLA